MQIVRPYAKILNANVYGEEHGMQHIEWCARISHRAEEAQSDVSWRRFISEVVLKHGDWSVVEHVSVTVDAVVDRGITHEWVRHRLFSFTQESTRFVNYDKKMPPSFIYPKPEVECKHCLAGNFPEYNIKNGGCDYLHILSEETWEVCAYEKEWLLMIDQSEHMYKRLLVKGWRPQEARSVFPNALASRIVTTGNLRNWRHFFIMRTTMEAHPQMKQVTIPLLAEFKRSFPLIFDDIEPLAKQSESMKRMR
jgi:thymidylate synthase (FAD)